MQPWLIRQCLSSKGGIDLGKFGSVVYVVVVMAFLLPFVLIGGLYIFFMGMKFLLPLIVVSYLIIGTLMVMSFSR